ncbi:MAG: hypothetical protein KC620_00175 [Myxococcales bacterium]|nr:hypothetical protein [Myxococcales bacterium]
MNEPSEQVFRFKYSVFTVDVRFDGPILLARTGVRTVTAPLERLSALYVRTEGDSSELVLAWRTDKGRHKRARIFADAHEPEFARLVDALLARKPGIDLRGLSPAKAYAQMGARELDGVVLPAVMAVAMLLVAFMFGPLIVHGFDRDHAEVTIEQLASGERPATDNLSVRGKLALEHGLIDPGKSGGEGSVWLPLVPEGWTPEAPVAVVLHAQGRVTADLDALVARDVYSGIVRDVWWEGLDDRRVRALAERGVRLADAPLLLDYGATPGADLGIVGVVLGLMALILFAVAVGLNRQTRKLRSARMHRPALNRPAQRPDDDD